MRMPLWVIGLTILLCAASAAQEVRIVKLEHREAAEIVPVLRQMLGDEGRIAAFEGKVLLRAEKNADLDTLEEVLRSLDTPRALLRISVRQSASRVSIRKEGETEVRIGTGTGSSATAQGRVLGTSEHTSDQSLSVMEGDTAVIVVGREVPVTHDILAMTGEHTAVVREVEHRVLTTGFHVRPQLRGEEALVDIAPHMAFLSPSDPQIVDFQHLSTSVRIPLGQWYNLADHLVGSSEVTRAILTLRAGGEEPDRAVWIKVEHP